MTIWDFFDKHWVLALIVIVFLGAAFNRLAESIGRRR